MNYREFESEKKKEIEFHSIARLLLLCLNCFVPNVISRLLFAESTPYGVKYSLSTKVVGTKLPGRPTGSRKKSVAYYWSTSPTSVH